MTNDTNCVPCHDATVSSDPSEVAEVAEREHLFASVNSIIFVCLVCICMVIGYKLKKHKVYYLPESGASMLFGLLVGGFIALAGQEESDYVKFKPDVFFFALLPPIIFEAGYSLKRSNFFRNIGAILIYAVGGTFISTLVIGGALYGFAQFDAVPLDSSDPLESLMFGALISAVDPVATLSILGSKEVKAHPLLYSLVFGESVLNDAVSIVAYRTLEGFHRQSSSASSEPEVLSVTRFIAKFLGVFCGSIVCGAGTALLASLLLKKANLKKSPSSEITVFMLFAYGTYCLAEMLEMSGIVSIFVFGITMAHYAFFNISRVSQQSTHHVFKAFAHVAETFCFIYLGIYAGLNMGGADQERAVWSLTLIVITLALCLVSRAVNIFPLTFFVNFFRTNKIPLKFQIAMWFAGLRGAIAFALALNIPTENREVIITTTLTVVFFTTLVGGGLTYKVVKRLGVSANSRQRRSVSLEECERASLTGQQFNSQTTAGSDSESDFDEDPDLDDSGPTTKLERWWARFEESVMRPMFGGGSAEFHDLHRLRRNPMAIDGDEFDVHLPSERTIPQNQHSFSSRSLTGGLGGIDDEQVEMASQHRHSFDDGI